MLGEAQSAVLAAPLAPPEAARVRAVAVFALSLPSRCLLTFFRITSG